MKTTLQFSLLAATMLLASCNKDLQSDNNNGEDITMDNIRAENFDFSGTRNVTVNIGLPAEFSAHSNSTFSIYNGNPDQGGAMIAKFTADDNQRVQHTLVLPTVVDTLYINNSLMGWTKTPIIGNVVNHEYIQLGGEGADALEAQRSAMGKTGSNQELTSPLVYSKKNGVLAGSIVNGDFSGATNFNTVSGYWSSINTGQWVDAYGPSSDNEVYNFSGNMVYKFEDTDDYDGIIQKISASGNELIELEFDVHASKKSEVYAYILSRNGNTLVAWDYVYFKANGSTQNNWYTKTLSATTAANTDNVLIEFYCKTDSKHGDYLYIDNVSVNGNNDSDGDGVDDNFDDFPNDPNLAYLNYYPNSSDFGSVVFEDLWPSQGDYDFNDLSIAYQYAFYNNASNATVEMEGTYHVRATGAEYNNGFGVALPVAPANISSVSGYDHAGGLVTLNANGSESGHSSEAVVIVYDKINDFMGGNFFNVEPGGYTTQADTTRVVIEFNQAQSFTYSAFDPFIFVNGDRGREVHLKNYDPTALADMSLFGTVDDASNLGSGVSYQNANGLPWAIDIPVEFEHMIEKNEILNGYLHFGAWAQSNGTVYNDWYINQSAGYRNNSLIY